MSEKRTANEILASHGPSGWLIRRLQRYGLLGWILFVLTLAGHFGLVALSVLMPRPLVAVDQAGRVLGVLEYLKPEARSDEEIMATTKRFASLFLSLNSATIFEDYAEAMNMMGGPLLETTRASIQPAGQKDNSEEKAGVSYLARVAAAKARAWVEIPRDGIKIIERRGLTSTVRVVGNIVIQTDGAEARVEHPFDLTLGVDAVARNSQNTSGLAFVSRRDN